MRRTSQHGISPPRGRDLADQTVDEGEEETVFQDAIERLRASALKAEIDELNAKARMHGLTIEEETRRAELLAAKVRLQPR